MENSNIVVVSGASSGIGQSLARELHKRGHNLVLVARRRERLEALKSELQALRAGSVDFRICDLTVRSEVEKLAIEISAMNVIGLVNNAGIGSLGPFHTLSLKSELAQVELNVVAPMILTHAVSNSMITRKAGFIINVSSIMAYQAVPYVATYAATKAFEWRHSLAIQRELSDHGIKVLTLCPGPTETEFFGVAKVPGAVTGFKRASSETVAKTCLRDLDAGKKISIPTFTAKVLVFAAMILPTSLYTWAVKRKLKPILNGGFVSNEPRP